MDDFTRACDRNTKVSRQPVDTQHACSSGLTKREPLVLCILPDGGFVARFSLAATSQGATEQEALANIQEAIREYLEAAADLNKDAEIREVQVTV